MRNGLSIVGVFLLAMGVLSAQNPARVDISGVPSIPLKFAEQSGVRIGYGTWQKPQHVKMYLSTTQEASDEWKKGEVSFTPEKDGRVRFTLLGPQIRGGKMTRHKPEGVFYDNVRINGELIPNGDFEAGKKGFSFVTREPRYPGRILFNPVLAKSGNACALAWHDGAIAFGYPVQAGKRVTLSFDYRSAGEVSPEEETNQFYPISLVSFANMGFADEVAGDGKGGWTDQGPKNDLRSFSPGVKSFHSWPFRILDPGKNGGHSCVIFKGKHSPFGREKIVLPVNRVCNAIALLNACAWAKAGNVAATVEVVPANGKTMRFPLIVGKQTGDWWNPGSVPDAEIAWKSGGANGEIGLYSTVLKWKKPAMIRSVSIASAGGNVVFGLVAVTAGEFRKAEDDTAGLEWKIPLGEKAALTVLPLEQLKLEMAKAKFPAELFFNEKKCWNRLEIRNEKGEKLEHCIVKFTRNISPLIFVRTGGKTESLLLRIGTEANGKILSPRRAFRLFTGKEKADYRADEWGKGLFVYPENVTLRQTRTVPDEDSFYNSAEAMSAAAPEWIFSFELTKPKAYKIYVYSRSPENFTNYVFLSVDNGKTIKVGGNYHRPSSYYWSGGERIFLKPGKHTIRIFSMSAKERRKHLSLSKLFLSEDLLSPVQPGLAEELNALRKEGIFVWGTRNTVLLQKTVSREPLTRFMNANASYPDLSSLTRELAIDRRGILSPDGTEFRFKNGDRLPQIWGCNMGTVNLYDLAQENRFGGDSLDRFLKRIKSMGYSTVRYMISTLPRTWSMNQNNYWMPLLSVHPLKFSPDFLTNLQKLIAACHRNGLYLSLTLWHDNCFFSDLGADRSNHAYIGFFHPEAIRRQKEIVRMILGTPNPYRDNLPPAKDPTLLIYEIENERTYVATFQMNNPSNWRKLPPATQKILHDRWTAFLKKKYRNTEKLKKSWKISSLAPHLVPGQTAETLDNLDFPPTWNVKEWGNDSSDFKVKLDDLRITEASFGKEKLNNPMVSDGLEFMYELYRNYLKEMSSFARSLGFRGVITANGPDCELHYSQRAAANEILDAVSGGTGYWNRSGYGFLRSLSWLAPMVYASAPGKPVISREYGANLIYENCWWGNLIVASVQKAMGKAYLFNFILGYVSLQSSDWFYPEDNFEKRERINLSQDVHLYSHFANLASAIAVRSSDLEKSKFKLEIGFPLDNVCYAAPFRGYNKMTLNDFVPFLYTDSSVRTFRKTYDGNADLVVNEPSLPAGDYSPARNLFAIRPHSLWNRAGQTDDAWFRGKIFQAEGFLDKTTELKAFYDTLQKAGARLPVSFAEFGKVWRDAGKHLEIDTRSATFRAETSTFSSFIGNLENGKTKMPEAFRLSGSGDAWSFFGKLPDSTSLFFAVMNGSIDLCEGGSLRYLFLGGRDIRVTIGEKPFLSLLGGHTVNLAVKSENSPLADAPVVYVTFFRNRSVETPAELTFSRTIRKVEACGQNGEVLAEIPAAGKTFRNLWENGSRISFYRFFF
ncbi:MAG: hypothetical protein ACI4UV_17405 [Victivallales bacterium]